MDTADNAPLIRVMLVDMQAAVLSHVRAMLVGAADIAVVAETATASRVAGLAVRLRPHAIITELTGSNGDGVAALRRLAAIAAGSRILVVSARPQEEWLLGALDAGAAGFVSTRAPRDEVLTAIRAVANDQIILRRSAIGILTGHERNGHATTQHTRTESDRVVALLTPRERTVFRLIAEGYSAPEVGRQLRISKKTVETYKKRIGEKLGIRHRADFVRFALQVHVLSAPRSDDGR